MGRPIVTLACFVFRGLSLLTLYDNVLQQRGCSSLGPLLALRGGVKVRPLVLEPFVEALVIVIDFLTLKIIVVCVRAVEYFILGNTVIINSRTALACRAKCGRYLGHHVFWFGVVVELLLGLGGTSRFDCAAKLCAYDRLTGFVED
jgi:hypothetical protein